MFSKIDHIFGDKGIISRYKKIEITPGILSYHHRLKLDSSLHNKGTGAIRDKRDTSQNSRSELQQTHSKH